MRLASWIGRTIATAVLATTLNASAAKRVQCDQGQVEVDALSATATDIEHGCESIEKATAFLHARGLAGESPVTVRIVDELPWHHGIGLLGQFREATHEVRVLSMSRCLTACDDNRPFKCKASPEVCASFVVHEVAHALIHGALREREIPRLNLEYLAYVTQFATLPPATRDEIIRASGLAGADFAQPPDEAAYLADPNQFAVGCFLHYGRPENGDAYLRRLFGR